MTGEDFARDRKPVGKEHARPERPDTRRDRADEREPAQPPPRPPRSPRWTDRRAEDHRQARCSGSAPTDPGQLRKPPVQDLEMRLLQHVLARRWPRTPASGGRPAMAGRDLELHTGSQLNTSA